jgi:hypothetical protein
VRGTPSPLCRKGSLSALLPGARRERCFRWSRGAGARGARTGPAPGPRRECIEFLRYLHDHRATRFALLLVGGDGTWKVLSREPMLRSRIYRRVSVEPLTPAEVCRLIPTYHPLYDGADAELLLLIDDHFAHGNLRHWAAFTKTATELCTAVGGDRIDEPVARNAFTLHGGGVGE